MNPSPYSAFSVCGSNEVYGFRPADMVVYNNNLQSVTVLQSQVASLASQLNAISAVSAVSAVPAVSAYNPAAFTSGIEFGAVAAGLMLTAWGFVAIRRVLLP